MPEQIRQEVRLAHLKGEILQVRQVYGLKQLTDQKGDVVCLQSGRQVRLWDYYRSLIANAQGRHLVGRSLFRQDGRISFVFSGRPPIRVNLDDLAIGQVVEVLPETESAFACVRMLPACSLSGQSVHAELLAA